MNTKFYKEQAKKALSISERESTFRKIALLCFIVSVAVTLLSNLIPGDAFISSVLSFVISLISAFIISPVIYYACSFPALKVVRNKDIAVEDAFAGLKNFGTIVIFNLLTTLLCLVGFICFIVPGIMMYYSYAMGYFIIADEPDITAGEVLSKSKAMMKGHRWELFKLHFSFIGWFILSLFTLGILTIWIEPKLYTATAVFYERIKAESAGENYEPCDYEKTSQECVPEEHIACEEIPVDTLTSE